MENSNIFSFISYFNNRIAFFITLFTHYVLHNLTQKMYFESTTMHLKCIIFKMLYCSFKCKSTYNTRYITHKYFVCYHKYLMIICVVYKKII